MSETPPDARVENFKAQIPILADLYVRITEARDPLSDDSRKSERLFEMEAAKWRDLLLDSSISETCGDVRQFKKALL